MKKFTKVFTLASLIILATAYQVFAQTEEKPATPLKFLFGGGIEFGGDKVAEVYFTNGNTQSVNAGQGASILVGGELQIPKVEKLRLRASIGFKYVTTAADNAHIRLTRIPLILTANYMITERIRIGAGLASHRNIKFSTDGLGENVTFKGASGPIFEVAYRGIGLTYTAMEYVDNKNATYSANAIGISLTGLFPKK